MQTGLKKQKAEIVDLRLALDNTIQSYIVNIDEIISSRHRRYLDRIPEKIMSGSGSRNASQADDESGNRAQDLVSDDTKSTSDFHAGIKGSVTRGIHGPD